MTRNRTQGKWMDLPKITWDFGGFSQFFFPLFRGDNSLILLPQLKQIHPPKNPNLFFSLKLFPLSLNSFRWGEILEFASKSHKIPEAGPGLGTGFIFMCLKLNLPPIPKTTIFGVKPHFGVKKGSLKILFLVLRHGFGWRIPSFFNSKWDFKDGSQKSAAPNGMRGAEFYQRSQNIPNLLYCALGRCRFCSWNSFSQQIFPKCIPEGVIRKKLIFP